MGDIVIQRDQSEVWWTGQPDWRPIDEANPPRILVRDEVWLFIRFVNQGKVIRTANVRAMITDPVGRVSVPTWHPGIPFPRDLRPGVINGAGFLFITQTLGTYSFHFEVFADGDPSDSWSFPACIAVGPAPEPVLEVGALTNVMGMVLVAELVVGLAEGIIVD